MAYAAPSPANCGSQSVGVGSIAQTPDTALTGLCGRFYTIYAGRLQILIFENRTRQFEHQVVT
jgi:hypothetical protein